jgi:hypothetical protein
MIAFCGKVREKVPFAKQESVTVRQTNRRFTGREHYSAVMNDTESIYAHMFLNSTVKACDVT